jgi:hypothetical protein
MKILSRLVAIALIGLVAAVVACSDSTGSSGPKAASVTGVAGDTQVAPTGHPLDFPLSLTLLGSNGQPIQGVAVSWVASPSNGATFAPQSAVSDVNGISSTVVTLGPVQDTIVITATVPGVQQPVVFHALAVDPCSFGRDYIIGATVNEKITTSDCNAGGYYNDFYLISFAAPTGMTINMTGTFNTWIDMYLDTGASLFPVAFQNDISPSNQNSRLPIVAGAGDYVIAPNTFTLGATGTYTLASASHPLSASNCELLFVTYGAVLSDSIRAADCPDAAGPGSYGDSLKIIVINGQVIKIAQRSTDVDPYLKLFHVIFRQGQSDSLELVASNNDSSATTTNAYISHVVPGTPGAQARLYIIFAGTNVLSQTGAYVLDVSANTTLSAMALSKPRSGWGFSLGSRVIPQLGLRRGL